MGVDVTVEVAAKSGYDSAEVRARVKDALKSYFSGEILGENLLLARLNNVVYGCDGVENYRIVRPAGDMAVNADQLPVLSGLTVEELE